MNMRRRLAPLPRLAVAALLLAGAAAVRPAPAAAQQDTVPLEVSDSTMEIRLADGSTVYGRIVSTQGGRVVIQTAAGARIEVDRAQIRSMRPVQGTVRDGEVWYDDPHRTRLFLGPTGRSLRAGEGFFGVYEVFFPVVSYGIAEGFTLTGGLPVIPGALGEVAYIEPKLSVHVAPQLDVAVGASVLFGTGAEGSAGLVYGAATYGVQDHALHVMAGLPFFSDDSDDDFGDEGPLVMIGGETRVSRRIKLLTENYVIPGESGAIVSGGARIFGERLSADAGLAFFLGEECDGQCFFPVVNFAYTFGRKR
ncbi:MAG TPA: hypothetical protein VEW03_01285 [Longimicrobiaceae bacterium]|nr:hypothetical protein [Longimicrobiaceae bacterium]